MKKFAVVAGVIVGALALIGSFMSGAMFIWANACAKGDVQVTGKPDDLRIKTRRRKYTETRLPEDRHYGF